MSFVRLLAFGILAVAISLPVMAQRGHGGGMGASSHASGFHGAPAGGAHFGAPAGGAGFGQVNRPPVFATRGARPSERSFGGRFGFNRPFGGGFCRGGFGCGAGFRFRDRFGRLWPYYPYEAFGGWYPWYDWDNGYADNYNGDNRGAGDAQAAFDEQRANREQEEELAEQSAGTGSEQRRSAARGPAPAEPNTVLVFRNGSRQEVRNYAIVGNTLYDLGPQQTRKILLSELDIPTTTRVNGDHGVEFELPRK